MTSAPDQPGDTGPELDADAEQAAPAPTPEGAQPAAPAEPTLEEQLAERTADLQRLQAEYQNYKRRVDRDRELIRAQGGDKVLESLLTVLDDLDRADQHGELVGGFKAVADALKTSVAKHGLERFGVEGDAFDPVLHEAVTHTGESGDVAVTSVSVVMRTGYRVGERVLRTAVVGVVDPAPASAASDQNADTAPTDEADA